MKTSSEVANLVGIKRQRIQEYEKVGIALKPTVKDKHGYWLYGETEIERLWQIKFYLTLDFTVPEIKAIFTNPSYNKHDAIADQIIKLEEKKKQLESMINLARSCNEMDILPSDVLSNQYSFLEYLQYDSSVAFISKVFSTIDYFLTQTDWEQVFTEPFIEDFLEDLLIDWPTKESEKQWIIAIEKIAMFKSNGLFYKDLLVQEQVSIMHNVDSNVFPKSIVKSCLRTYFMINMYLQENLTNSFGQSGYDYISAATKFYFENLYKNVLDNFDKTPLGEVLSALENYAHNRFTTGSTEVQDEIKKIHAMISSIGFFPKSFQLHLLTLFSDLFNSSEAKVLLDNSNERGICWFISRAIQIYCNHQLEELKTEGTNDEQSH